MKHRPGPYYRFPRQVFPILQKSKNSTKWLFTCLCELEHKFTGKKEDFFFHSIKDLCLFTGQSSKTVMAGLRELVKLKLIQIWQMHWLDKETNKKTEKHITAIRINI